MILVGIDPGLKGAICSLKLSENAIHIEAITFHSMPTNGRDLDLHRLAEIFEELKNTHHAFLEKVSAMPKQGVASMFKFGKTVGSLEALLAAYKIPFMEVTPQVWQKNLHAGSSFKNTDTPKQRSLTVAKKLFPRVSLLRTEKTRMADQGFVDSLLLAEYGRRWLTGSGRLMPSSD